MKENQNNLLQDCGNMPLPLSYIKKQIAEAREKYYNDNYKKFIKDAFEYEDYSISEFINLINSFTETQQFSGMRIYFGAKKNETEKSNIVLVFSPTINDTTTGIKYQEKKDYYIWSSNNFSKISLDKAKNLINNYFTLYRKAISDNGIQVTDGNTKSVLLTEEVVKSLKEEMELPCHQERLKFIRASISSYLNTDKDDIKNRMIVQLQFVEVKDDGNHAVYGLDETIRDYNQNKITDGSFDTVNPCPPLVNCVGSDL